MLLVLQSSWLYRHERQEALPHLLFRLRYLQNISSRNLALVHQLVDLWQLFQVHNLEWSMDQAPLEEVKSLCTVRSVTDIAGLDADHPCHRLEDWCLDLGIRWQTDNDDCATWSDILRCLLEGFLVDCDQDDCVWPKAFWGGGTDVLDDIGALCEINEFLETRVVSQQG